MLRILFSNRYATGKRDFMDNFIRTKRGKLIRSMLTSLVLAAGVAGCSSPGQSIFQQTGGFHLFSQQEHGTVDYVRTSYAIADSLVTELRKGHPNHDPNVPILVVSFVDRKNLDSTSELGLILADHVASRMTQLGYTIIEPKLRLDLSIRKEEGEFLLSRDIEKLSQENGAYAAVVGSYTETLSAVDMTAKLVEVRDRKVLASVDVKMPLGGESRALLLKTGRQTRMEIVAQ